MQNQNIHSWPWGQGSGGQPFLPNQPVLPGSFASPGVEQNSFLPNYHQMYDTPPGQVPPDLNHWTAAQFQQWQQWQQWQEKYQEWQQQYGKKYAESLAAMGQNPGVLMPTFSASVPPPVSKPIEPGGSNPPLPSNVQPVVPPPPPEEEKPPLPVHLSKGKKDSTKTESKDATEELLEAERAFNVQFKQWESEFEEWKKQNQDHPDKAQYKEYEKKWETWREQLLQRLEQMKKKRLEKANEAKIGLLKEDPKGKPGLGLTKPPETDYGYRTQPPPIPQPSFSSEPPKYEKLPPMTQPPPNFPLREKESESNRGGSSFPTNFHSNQRSFGNFENNQERANQRFGNYEGEGRFRSEGPRFGNFDKNQPRRFEEKPPAQVTRFSGDNFRDHNEKGQCGNDNRTAQVRQKVPSLFDIQVEKPSGLEQKAKVWEKNDFDKKQGNGHWNTNFVSPWAQPPQGVEKNPSEVKSWERETLQTETLIDKAELSGYVGNILAKLGNVVPSGSQIEEKQQNEPETKGETGKQSETENKPTEDHEPNLSLDVDDRIRDRFRRGPFGRSGDRSFDRGPFGRRREERSFGVRFPREDIDERFGPPKNGRRGFDRFDRDERQGGMVFDRYGNEMMREPVWKPQVFDYSQGRQTRLTDTEEGFKISTVVDYSHGENKQTFDYGHKGDAPTVIDYGHGVDTTKGDKDYLENRYEDIQRGNRELQPTVKRCRSPRGGGGGGSSFTSRSRSPQSKLKRNSNSPPFKNLASRNRDRFSRQGSKISDDRLSPSDGESSKHSFTVTTVLVQDLICRPGRDSRPNKLVFIMRGLPGSGKTYVTKLIKDKEVELGGDPPRILSLDDYFMTEVEKETIDPETGRKVKTKTLEYEYEAGVEPHYRGSLVKAFRKTVSDGFFSFIIVDSVNEKTKDYEEMWSFAKQKGFQVYIAEMDNDVTVCTGRNIHKRTEKEISDLAKVWEETPIHYLRLDVRSLLQSDAITEVEMEVVSDTELEKTIGNDDGEEKEEKKDVEEENKKTKRKEERKEDEDEDEPGVSAFVKSRWDQFENSEQNLDRLDGLKRRREGFHATMEDYLQLPDDFDQEVKDSVPGKKRVRWADLEERKQQEKMRAIGFVVGQTDWSRMTDPTFGESALTRTKYI